MDQADIHRKCSSERAKDRVEAAELLYAQFSNLPDIDLAWQDLHKLTQDEESNVREAAAQVLGSAFSSFPNKELAWQELESLIEDDDHDVQYYATEALQYAFPYLPYKYKAWRDLEWLTDRIDYEVRRAAANAYGSTFAYMPDRYKPYAWSRILSETEREDDDVSFGSLESLALAFPYVPNKEEAWKDLYNLAQSENEDIKFYIDNRLGIAFYCVPDKLEAWQDLREQTRDGDSDVRIGAALALGQLFPQVPDKDLAWQDLHTLSQDMDNTVRRQAALALGQAFPQVPDKDLAWQDLIRLTQEMDDDTRWKAADPLTVAFSHVSDKAQAWKDLIGLIQNNNDEVRREAADAMSRTFSQVSNMDQAWQDLHSLTHNQYSYVRMSAANALLLAIGQAPNKDQAWQDLIRLAQDLYSDVRWRSADILPEAIGQVSNMDQAWQDLIRLTQGKDCYVRMYAYHSLGKASIIKAAETDDRDTLKRELEAAIEFFEKSYHENAYSPARFCRSFYRSYFAIIFQKAKDEEVQKYLAEAKGAVGSSESKDELLKAIENLAQALTESQRLKEKPFHEIINELNAYMWYFEKAAEHMRAAENKAPRTVKLMKICNPFLEERIQNSIAEIQKLARQICQTTYGSGTKLEAQATEIHKQAKVLSEGDLVSVQNSSSRIIVQLQEFCKLLPEKDRGSVCDVVKEIEYAFEFPEKLHLIEIALSHLNPILGAHRISKVDIVILSVLPEEYDALSAHLTNLEPPSDMGSAPNLYAWQFGGVPCPKFKGTYKIAIGMIGRPGNNQSALAVKEAIQLWRPRYIIFSGVAGGLPNPKRDYADLELGYVVIADAIYGYEYGKIDGKFEPRGNYTKNTDPGLFTSARVYAHRGIWRKQIIATPPKASDPKAITGEIASGEKVVDDRNNEFFLQVLNRWPKIKAVEMEGAGVGSAIEQAHGLGVPIGFMVIRGISDLLLAKEGDCKSGGTEVRDAWKAYASDTAAAFTVGWIGDGLPLPPFILI